MGRLQVQLCLPLTGIYNCASCHSSICIFAHQVTLTFVSGSTTTEQLYVQIEQDEFPAVNYLWRSDSSLE